MEFVPGETLEASIARDGRARSGLRARLHLPDLQRRRPCASPRRPAPRSAAVERPGLRRRPDQGRRLRHLAVSRDRRARHDDHRQPAVHGAGAVSRQGGVRQRHLLGRGDDVPDADRRSALRHAVAGRCSNGCKRGEHGRAAAPEESEDSARHRRASWSRRWRRTVTRGISAPATCWPISWRRSRRAPRRRADADTARRRGCRQRGAAGYPDPAEGARDAARRDSAGTAASRCTPAPTAVRSAAKRSSAQTCRSIGDQAGPAPILR